MCLQLYKHGFKYLSGRETGCGTWQQRELGMFKQEVTEGELGNAAADAEVPTG